MLGVMMRVLSHNPSVAHSRQKRRKPESETLSGFHGQSAKLTEQSLEKGGLLSDCAGGDATAVVLRLVYQANRNRDDCGRKTGDGSDEKCNV